MSTWWDRATVAQRLAQIDAGIALGMSSKQIAMNLRVEADQRGISKLVYFANSHGRHFSRFTQRSTRRAAGMTGGIVSSRRRGIPDYTVSSAHEIFGARDSEAYELSVLDTEDAA
jgi:hypothetical protein